MTESQYWDGDSSLTKAYRKADEIKRRNKEREMWEQGLYFYHALCSVAPALHAFSKKPEPLPYLKEPFPVSLKEQKERKERDEREQFEKMLEAFSKK